MKKSFALFLILCLFTAVSTNLALATPALPPAAALAGLSHNCPNTGIMLPETFDPAVSSYLLTVADWVSRVTLTPQSADPQADITVNGIKAASGQPSQMIMMTDDPQAVTISVTAPSGETAVYTVFLQRRPGEQRNSVRAGYLMDIAQQDGLSYLEMDPVSLTLSPGTEAGFANETVGDAARYPIGRDCIFYSGSGLDAKLFMTPQDFKAQLKLDGSELFYVVFIEGEIRAVISYMSNTLQAVRLTAAPDETPIASFVEVTPAPDGSPVTLHEGEGGALVKNLQQALKREGYYLGEVDGMYGTATTDAVLNFQKANKLSMDGIAGEDTQKLLYGAPDAGTVAENTSTGSFVRVTPSANGEYVSLKEGEMGELVTNLQQALTDKAFFHGAIDSFYGPDTKEAVMAFQKFHGLLQDGIASPATLQVLFEGKYPEGS